MEIRGRRGPPRPIRPTIGKEGVGIYVDAKPAAATDLEVRSDSSGWDMQVYGTAEDPPPDDIEGWGNPIGETTVTEERMEIRSSRRESSATTWCGSRAPPRRRTTTASSSRSTRFACWPDAQNSNSRSRSYRSTPSRTRRSQAGYAIPPASNSFPNTLVSVKPGIVLELVDQNLVLLRDEEVTAGARAPREREHPCGELANGVERRRVHAGGDDEIHPASEYFAS